MLVLILPENLMLFPVGMNRGKEDSQPTHYTPRNKCLYAPNQPIYNRYNPYHPPILMLYNARVARCEEVDGAEEDKVPDDREPPGVVGAVDPVGLRTADGERPIERWEGGRDVSRRFRRGVLVFEKGGHYRPLS